MTKDELQARVKELEGANIDLADAAAQSLDAERAENDRLRDELFAATIAKAKADGYRERVREFDPISPRDRERGTVITGEARIAFGDAAKEARPWYRRGRPDHSPI